MPKQINIETHPEAVGWLKQLRDARREIGAKSTQIDAEAKARKDALGLKEAAEKIDSEILRVLNEHGASTALMPNGDNLTRVVTTQLHVTDWPAYMKFVMQEQDWSLVQQRPGKRAVEGVLQAKLDALVGTLPGNEGADILDYYKPEREVALPPMPEVPGVRIAPKYAVKDTPKRVAK